MPHNANDLLAVFMRWPQPGQAKTRLEPLLGPGDTVRLYRALVEKTFAATHSLSLLGKRVIAYVEPADRCDDVAAWLGAPVEVWPQPDAGLGERCQHVFDRAFTEGAERVAIIGSDLPGIGGALLGQAFSSLREHDAVLGPAADGGYWLLGMARPVPHVFHDVPWSTDRVANVTRERLNDAGIQPLELPTMRDVDTPDDLHAVLPDWRDWLGSESSE